MQQKYKVLTSKISRAPRHSRCISFLPPNSCCRTLPSDRPVPTSNSAYFVHTEYILLRKKVHLFCDRSSRRIQFPIYNKLNHRYANAAQDLFDQHTQSPIFRQLRSAACYQSGVNTAPKPPLRQELSRKRPEREYRAKIRPVISVRSRNVVIRLNILCHT